MAIISASRRTDIPTYYSEWFMNCLKKGVIMTRNPVNPKNISKMYLNRETVDCIVFWTKNPIPMLPKMQELNEMGYPYYFQFTLTGYGKDIEGNLPSKEELIQSFKDLYKAGNGHIIWRYDPIIFMGKYDIDWHLQTFSRIASELKGYTDKCVISFVDPNSYARKNFGEEIFDMTFDTVLLTEFCKKLAEIAKANGMEVATCAEKIDLDECGIKHNKCIDPEYIAKIVGYDISAKKDKGQRNTCGCVESIDIGKYGTCKNGCRYCYAQNGRRIKGYDINSPLLCDKVNTDDIIMIRKLKSLKIEKQSADEQLSLF